MRQRFDQQLTIGADAIPDVKFSNRALRSRDELPPVLMALQYIFKTPELKEKIFQLIEKKVCSGKKKTGRKGMDLWQILVLAVVRHNLGTNWDRLEHIANNDTLTRKIMGIPVDCMADNSIEFSYQTLIDNVGLLDEDLIREVNQLVVKHGLNILKKKEDEALELKTDSYVVETNIHFPTDLNLSWDATRKCLDIIEALKKKNAPINGWRKSKSIRTKVKCKNRTTTTAVFKGKNPEKKRQAVTQYLDLIGGLAKRFRETAENTEAQSKRQCVLLLLLKFYIEYLDKFIDQIDRRLLQGEQIPAEEKVFSIFEPETEWINKGKLHPNVELGHRVLLTTVQHQFIADYKVMLDETDYEQIGDLAKRIAEIFSEQKIASQSFDKGFYSKENLKILMDAPVELVVLPKKGKLNKEEKERESDEKFKELRHRHSAVESNINMLEHHGLDRCPDKGLPGYKRYVGLCVLAYNLHILGRHLLAIERKKTEDECKDRQRKAKLRQAA